MHVLTLTPFYPTAEDDASGCFIAESVGELQRQGIESSVIAVQPIHQAARQPSTKAPPSVWVKYFSLPGNIGLPSAGRLLYAALKSRVRRDHGDRPISLIHAHAALPCGVAAMHLAEELGIPFVITIHGLDAFYAQQVQGLSGGRCRELSKKVYRAASGVICISEKVASCVEKGMGADARTSVVYNGVDPSLFGPSGPEIPGGLVILSVGNLIPIKGFELLLRAVAAVVPSCPDVLCQIIGDGPERKHLLDLTQSLRIENHVRFLGRRSRSEVAAAMKQCTLFALPSWYEGLGCVYLEAMSAERPAIACRGQGIEEVIRHRENGWLIQPKSLDDLTGALQHLLSDPGLRANLGRCGRETVLQGYTLADQAQHLLSIYRECAV